MSGYIPSKRALYVDHIDVGSADRHWAERTQLKDTPGHCVNWRDYSYDHWGREATPYSLNMGDPGCSNLNPYENVNVRIARENAERPFIAFAYPRGPSERFDTMGLARNMQRTGGGFDGEGNWSRVNMPKRGPMRPMPPGFYPTDSNTGGQRLAPIYSTRYLG